MRNRKNYNFLVIFTLTLFLSVGFAVVNSVSLSVTGSSIAAVEDLDVCFNGVTSVSDSNKVVATSVDGSTVASISVDNLSLNETVTATYTIVNNEKDVGAMYRVSEISLSSSDYFLVTTDSSSSKIIEPGETNTIKISVKMIKTPVTDVDSSTNIDIKLEALPGEMITFFISGSKFNAFRGMTWGEWVDSEFNNGAVSFYLDRLYMSSAFVLHDGVSIFATDFVVENGIYTVEACCFDAGTKILMADGTEKNIEDIEIGDYIMSLNEDTGEYIPQKVNNTIVNKNSTDLVYVYLSNGIRIGMRAYHPLLTLDGYKTLRPDALEVKKDLGDVELGVLNVGDILVGYEDNVEIIDIVERDEVSDYYTYNLSIEGYHNYVANGVVVHNAVCQDELD